MANIKARAAIDFSPPERRFLLVLLFLPGGTQSISKPPSNGFFLFSNLKLPIPPGCNLWYTLLKFLFTCSNTSNSLFFLSDSSFSAIPTRSFRRCLRILPSSTSPAIRSTAISYCSIANIFTSPR